MGIVENHFVECFDRFAYGGRVLALLKILTLDELAFFDWIGFDG